MEYYQNRYYTYQTTARGLLRPEQLKENFNRLQPQYLEAVGKFLPKNKSELILDMPCGYGNFLHFLKTQGYTNCRGFDFDGNQVALAQSIGLPAYEADVFNVLATMEERPSLIASLDFIEHVGKNSALRFLEECYQRLPPNGTLILRTPCADGPLGSHDIYNDITHEWGLTSNALDCILGMVGFESIVIVDPQPYIAGGGLYSTLRWGMCKITREILRLVFGAACIGVPRVWGRSMWAVAVKGSESRIRSAD